MTGRQINAVEAIRDIRSGMDGPGLMEKYKISSEGLRNLYKELASLGLLTTGESRESASQKVRINVKDFLGDFRRGLTDSDLMELYGLSREALFAVYDRLLELKAIAQEDLLGSEYLLTDRAGQGNRRELDRYCLDFELVIADDVNSAQKGTVKDISERGVGLAGIEVLPGEILTLAVHPDSFLEVKPFRFKAECKWSDTDSEDHLAGLEIIEMSESDRMELRKLMRLLELCS
jgi:hypothetical protein